MHLDFSFEKSTITYLFNAASSLGNASFHTAKLYRVYHHGIHGANRKKEEKEKEKEEEKKQEKKKKEKELHKVFSAIKCCLLQFLVISGWAPEGKLAHSIKCL